MQKEMHNSLPGLPSLVLNWWSDICTFFVPFVDVFDKIHRCIIKG